MKKRTPLVSGAAILLVALPLLADIRDGLVAYWPLNTATGAFPMTTPDVVGGNDLSGPNMDSATALVDGRFGKGVAFDGGSTYLSFVASPDSDTGLPVSKKGSWTVSVWVNAAPQAGGYYFLESSTSSATPLTAMTVRNASTNNSAIFVRDASGNNPVSFPVSTNVSIDSTWHHVAMTYDASAALYRLYVDGKVDYATSFVPNYANNSLFDQVCLGVRSRNGVLDLPFAGSVDDVALWARALSQAEVQEVMGSGIATPVPAFAPAVTAGPVGATNLLEGDSYTLTAFAYGSRPLNYQWQKDGTNIPGATLDKLVLANLTAGDSGRYRLVVANAVASKESSEALIRVSTFASPNLTNGMVAYWPLDTIAGVKTPDLVSAYDMTVNNMGSSNVVAGKWGNALQFDKAFSQFARVIYPAGSALPAYSRSNFTVSFWAKAPAASSGWAFTEASMVNNNPAFALGMLNTSALDMYVRTDSGGVSMNHQLSANTAVWDDAWHNVVWVQHDAGGKPKAELYIDGAMDPVNLNPAYPVTPNNTALGAYARATPNSYFTGLVDDVAIWERPLSPAEIALLQNGPITNPPSRLSPLVISSFKSYLPAVAQGDSTVLRWDVPANATQVLIDPLGDVTARTVSGIGTTNVTLAKTTTFVLTVKRGAEQVKATNTVSVVEGVEANWSLLDNFDSYNPGPLAANGWWVDIGGGSSVSVVAATNGNRLVKTLLNPSGAYLPLNQLTVGTNKNCTLFFRMLPVGNPATALKHLVGITDKSAQFYSYLENNVGPAVEPIVNGADQNPGDWLLAGRNAPYSPLTFDVNALQPGAVYSVWIDISNVFLNDRAPGNEDVFSVYIQREGDTARTLVFENFVSDRDISLDDPLTGLPTDSLNKVYVAGNSASDSALFDDFYLSKSGYNATIPRAFGYVVSPPTLAIERSGGGWQIIFQGKLMSADSITGPWVEVGGAASPYPVNNAGSMRFYRAASH